MTARPAGATDAGVLVRARDLRKTFQIHTRAAASLKEMVVGGFRGDEVTTLVALDGISFEVPRGRSLAIVGSNGSGKSTLLKMLSGISHPDSGTLEIHGRVAALLELGAGFHTDLTGMENIFLQGSILGLSRAEILGILEDVLDFCELGDFIHTPLKRYSSGMVVRLGFALAVFCEADLLLIDEVLAVGDFAFQKKCLRKIAELREEGRTIILVSHGLDQVEAVAEDVLWIEKGSVRAHGPLEEVLPLLKQQAAQASLAVLEAGDHNVISDPTDARDIAARALSGRGGRVVATDARITGVVFRNQRGEATEVFDLGGGMSVEVEFEVLRPVSFVEVQIGILGFMDLRAVWGRSGTTEAGQVREAAPGRYRGVGRVDRLPMTAGQFIVSVALVGDPATMGVHDAHVEAYTLHVRPAPGGDGGVAVGLPPGKFRPAP